MSERLPLSFYDTNRPMNMGFDFTYPTTEPIATQTERELIPTLENQTDNNLEIVNNESSESSDLSQEEEEEEEPPIMRVGQIQNPFTGRMINIGSNTFKKLVKKHIIDNAGNLLISSQKLEYLVGEYKLNRYKI